MEVKKLYAENFLRCKELISNTIYLRDTPYQFQRSGFGSNLTKSFEDFQMSELLK